MTETASVQGGRPAERRPSRHRRPRGSRAQDVLAKYGVPMALIVTIAIFSALKPEVFPTGANFKAIAQQFAPLAIAAFGMTVVLVMGDFDLSLAGMIGMGTAVIVSLMSRHGMDYRLAIVVGLLVGIVGGVANGILVAFLGASSFIITLASGQVFTGLEYKITNQETIFAGIPSGYVSIASSTLLGLSTQFFVMLGVGLVMYLLLEQSTIGRHMYAIGGNPEAARLAGIRVRETRMLGFVIVALCAVVAGLLITSQNASHSPNMGAPFFLPAFAAAFLGSAMLRPGRFNMIGTLVGAFFLEVISTGLIEMSFSTSDILLVQGVILAASILLSRLGRKSA